jgi:hypothetical protein
MINRVPYKERGDRIADMLQRRHPEFSRDFAVEAVKSSWIRDISAAQWLGEAEHAARFMPVKH